MRITDTHIFFWGGVFSNFHETKITINGLQFNSSEQFFMYEKAICFEDFEIAKLILEARSPKDAKKLGRKVKNFNESEWSKVREQVMFKVCFMKFSQNPFLKEALLKTEDKILVESSPWDCIWGVGLSKEDDSILDENNWRGQNLLGKTLMKVRATLRTMAIPEEVE